MNDNEAQQSQKQKPLTVAELKPPIDDEAASAHALIAKDSQHPMADVVRRYLASLRNIGQTVQIVMPHLQKWLVDEIKKNEKKLSHYMPDPPRPGIPQEVTLESARDFVEFTSTVKQLEELQSNRALPVLARSLFMQMFCEFDAFMGTLLKTIYTRNENLLKGISREITLSDLLQYENIDAAKRAMLDKEIETFRRDSYVEQFCQLEKKFSLTLRKFPEWGEFVELTQRRNIFTHNDGMISDQYVLVCEREGWEFGERPKLGSTLQVDILYFSRALQVLSKVGFMLTHTLWSKVFPHEEGEMHKSVNECLYAALEAKRWKTAAEMGEFALSDAMRKNVPEIDLRIRVINCAIALKFSDRDVKAKKLLRAFDWSASYRDFKLALHVLEDNFEEAVRIMKSIGKSGEILEQHYYHSWPLFHKFRERPEFYATYEAIYGEPYLAKVPHDGNPKSVAISPTAPAKSKASPRGRSSITKPQNGATPLRLSETIHRRRKNT